MLKQKGLTVNAIFRIYGSAYRLKYKGHIPHEQYRIMNAIESCRTIRLGGHLYRCNSCGRYHRVYNSCKNRHCPTCQSLKTAEWLLKRNNELLPVQYFHTVFTVPDDLNPIILQNKYVMYTLLFDSVSKTLIQLSKDPKYLDTYQIGFISALHTWSQTLLDHPHIHCIVTGGGLSKDKKSWIPCKKGYFINVKVLSRRFRSVFLKQLKVLYRKQKLNLFGKIKELESKVRFQNLIDILFNKEWVVYSECNYSDPAHIFDYLGRYTQRVAISNNRIIKIEDDRVYFRYKDYPDNGKMKVMNLCAFEFIRRILLHVLPKRFVKLRYYGLLGYRNRQEKIALCRKLLGVEKSELTRIEIPECFKELYELVTGNKIDRCPYCEEGKLILVSDIARSEMIRGP